MYNLNPSDLERVDLFDQRVDSCLSGIHGCGRLPACD
jgi:hypothetical protein